MVIVLLDTVSILEHRLGFLEGISEIATQCNWAPGQIQELHDYLLDEVIKIDNLMFDTYEETEDPELAYLIWEAHMEDLRRWLGLILGIKIKYV
jgi:hypothetical protein